MQKQPAMNLLPIMGNQYLRSIVVAQPALKVQIASRCVSTDN